MSNRYQVRLSLSAETGRALERLSRITGKSVPKLTASFLDDAKDALHIMGDALEAADEVKGWARLEYLRGFEESTKQIVDVASDAKTVLANMGSPSGRAPARRLR